MAEALKDRRDYQVKLHEGAGFGLAKVTSGVPPIEQPVWNEDGNLCLVMEGEIFNVEEIRDLLARRGHRLGQAHATELILRLYEELGNDFVTPLNGSFVIAIWNARARQLVVVNDHLGLHPVYFTRTKNRFLFASGVRSLLTDPDVDRTLDPVAAAQMLTFEYPLGDRTLIRSVALLPPASILTLTADRMDIRSYWTLEFSDLSVVRSEESYLEELYHLLRQAVHRQKHPAESGILLSGGLDSRILLGLLTEDGPGALQSFTFGITGCSDARMAGQLARVAGTPHHFHELKPDYLLKVAEFGVRVTDGFESVVHMHALANLDRQARIVPVLYKGYLGDALMGGHLWLGLWGGYSEEDQARLFFDRAAVLFKEAEHKDLFSERVYKEVNGAAFESFREALNESHAGMVANRFNHFDLRQRQRRFILNGLELVRSRVVVRAPFCDKDLVNFMLTVPLGLRLNRRLITEILIRRFPKLSKVPCTTTGFPLVPCAQDLLMRINLQLRWRLRAAGLKWVKPPRSAPYANYALWFRTSLKDWAESILLDPRTLDRGYFNPEYVRRLVSRHMAGEDHSGKLGVLISLELWHRRFLDGRPEEARSPSPLSVALTES